MIKIENLSISFQKELIFEHVNIELSHPGLYGLIGESGTGKSTLLNILGLVETRFTGTFTFLGQDIQKMKEKDLAFYRYSYISYLFQTPKLIYNETLKTNINLSMHQEVPQEEIISILKDLSLDTKLNTNINLFSGGELQRANLAICLLKKEPLILLDEVTSGLDENSKVKALKLIKKKSKESIIIFASHDIELLQQFTSKIYGINHKTIQMIKVKGKMNINPLQKKNHLSFSYLCKHVIHIIKTRKLRTLVCSFSSIMALVCLGFSLLLTSSIKTSLVHSLKSSIDDQQIIMNSKEEDNTIVENISIEEKEIIKIKKKYPTFLSYGVSYISQFNDMFPDQNYVSLTDGNFFLSLPGYSLDTIANFQLLNQENLNLVYTTKPILQEDEIIISLSNNEVYTLSKRLHIDENKLDSLFFYLQGNPLYLEVVLENLSWEYSLNTSLKIVGYQISSQRYIYHSSSLWNEYMLEEVCQLLPSLDQNKLDEYPWTIKKQYYLLLRKEDVYTTLEQLLKDEELNDFSFYIKNKEEPRIYFTYSHSKKIQESFLENLLEKEPCLSSFLPCSQNGFQVVDEALLSGFSFTSYLSNQYNLLEEYEDANCFSPSNLGPYQSTILTLTNSSLQSCSYLDASKENSIHLKSFNGQSVKYQNEKNMGFYVSKDLAKQLQIDESNIQNYHNAYLLVLSSIEYVNQKYENRFIIANLPVKGVVDEEGFSLYSSPLLINEFLMIECGKTREELSSQKTLFTYVGNNIEQEINDLSLHYPEYTFSNPFLEYTKKVDEVIEYINIALLAFSSFCFISSFLMMVMASYLFVNETRKEIGIYTVLGFSKKSIKKQFKYFSIFLSFYAYFQSSLCILILLFIFNLSNMPIRIEINQKTLLPFIFMFIITSVISIFSSEISVKKVFKENPVTQLNQK